MSRLHAPFSPLAWKSECEGASGPISGGPAARRALPALSLAPCHLALRPEVPLSLTSVLWITWLLWLRSGGRTHSCPGAATAGSAGYGGCPLLWTRGLCAAPPSLLLRVAVCKRTCSSLNCTPLVFWLSFERGEGTVSAVVRSLVSKPECLGF